MLDGVFHQQLQQHRRHAGARGGRVHLPGHAQALLVVQLLQRDVVAHHGQLVGQRHALLGTVLQRVAQGVGQATEHLAGAGRVFVDQRPQVVQRVEQKVRVDLGPQHLELQLAGRGLGLPLGDLALAPALQCLHPQPDGHPQPQQDGGVERVGEQHTQALRGAGGKDEQAQQQAQGVDAVKRDLHRDSGQWRQQRQAQGQRRAAAFQPCLAQGQGAQALAGGPEQHSQGQHHEDQGAG
mmetsp:Transcript_53148/g.124463  ORF Transcript_53148/g.124463 Transcript_53148/m.124463 type:complete len:238 (-) Transcript_53148:138-851(-)